MRRLLFAGFLLLSCAASAAEPAPLVFIDPGHGGRMGGALGPRKAAEKTVALQVSRKVRDRLQERLNVRVAMTREKDEHVDLAERIEMANRARADLFISIHCNAMPPGKTRKHARGVETYFLSAEATGEQARRVAALENAEARKEGKPGRDPLANILSDLAQTQAHHDASLLAYAVHERVVRDLGANDRGVHQAPFYVLMGAQMPAILFEVGFITNPAEARQLTDPEYQEQIAEAIVSGIAGFLQDVARRRMATGAKDGAAAR